MRPVRFWAREAQSLPELEKAYLREAIEMLLSWEPLRKEYAELDILRRMLDPAFDESLLAAGSFEEEAEIAPKVLHHSYKKT
jgi:hypothetical protein